LLITPRHYAFSRHYAIAFLQRAFFAGIFRRLFAAYADATGDGAACFRFRCSFLLCRQALYRHYALLISRYAADYASHADDCADEPR
jgi:hypothetical protein